MRKKIVSILLVLVATLLIAGTAYALFTATVQSNPVRMKAAELHFELRGGYDMFLDVKPGDTGQVEFEIENTGTLDFEYVVTFFVSGTLFEGNTPLRLSADGGSLAAGESETIIVYWEMPYEAGNSYQGASGYFEIIVNAYQYPLTPTPTQPAYP